MKRLRTLREHFVSTDNGATWIPKKVFESEQDVKNQGFHSRTYHAYICGFCGKYHVHKKKGK